nr:hypothetical protein [Actinomycetota bacterium]
MSDDQLDDGVESRHDTTHLTAGEAAAILGGNRAEDDDSAPVELPAGEVDAPDAVDVEVPEPEVIDAEDLI